MAAFTGHGTSPNRQAAKAASAKIWRMPHLRLSRAAKAHAELLEKRRDLVATPDADIPPGEIKEHMLSRLDKEISRAALDLHNN